MCIAIISEKGGVLWHNVLCLHIFSDPTLLLIATHYFVFQLRWKKPIFLPIPFHEFFVKRDFSILPVMKVPAMIINVYDMIDDCDIMKFLVFCSTWTLWISSVWNAMLLLLTRRKLVKLMNDPSFIIANWMDTPKTFRHFISAVFLQQTLDRKVFNDLSFKIWLWDLWTFYNLDIWPVIQ